MADKLISRAGSEHRNSALVIRSGRILDLGKRDRMVTKYPGHRVVRLDRAVLMPGLVNVHAHLELPPLLERIQGKDYPDWVLNLIRAKAGLTFRDYTVASQTNIASVIRSGTTTIAEICTHGASPPVIARSGMRAVIFREIISLSQNAGSLTLPRRERPTPLIWYGLSPHSPHTVSEAALNDIRRFCLKSGVAVSMHVAETREEIRLLRRRKSGLERLYAAAGWETAWAPRSRSSFEYLQRTGMLGPWFLAVHAVQTDDADISIIKRTGACIAHCPRSNRALRVGKMHLAKFLRARVPVGLGTDSLASVPSLNLWDEMRYALRVHRSSGITATAIFRLATLGGAKALGMDNEIGSLEPGKRADCIAVPLPARDTGDLYSDLLRETKSCIMNMVNGNIIYQQHSAQRK